MPLPNTARSVFLVVNMLTGPEYTGPNKDLVGTKCWPFTGGLNSTGRPYISIEGKKLLAYRVVYELVTGRELERTDTIMHGCDNPVCCNPAHLQVGDHDTNMKEMRDRERHGLPHHTVRAIRKLVAAGATHKSVGDLYGLGRSTVTEIVSGLKYRDVTEESEDGEDVSR